MDLITDPQASPATAPTSSPVSGTNSSAVGGSVPLVGSEVTACTCSRPTEGNSQLGYSCRSLFSDKCNPSAKELCDNCSPCSDSSEAWIRMCL